MVKNYLIVLVSLFCFTSILYAQYPVSANLRDEKGLRTGHWTIWYDSLFHETHNIDSVRYYRIARFEAGKPVGKVRDFYGGKQKQWDGFIISLDPEIKHGEATYFYENGKVMQQCVFDHDKLNGIFKSYHTNGNLKSEGMMKQDTSVGTWSFYYEEGPIQAKVDYKRSRFDGPYMYYYLNGTLQSKGNKKNGVSDGYWETFYENGKIETKANYKNDLYDGPYEKYDENGLLLAKGAYKNNNHFGVWKYFHSNGKLKNMGKNQEDATGNKTGEWKYYTEDGKLEGIYNLKNGLYDGISTVYYVNGKLSSKGIYKNNVKDSIWAYFYDNGKVKSTGAYLADSASGPWMFYHSSGIKSTEGNYVNNKYEGQWKFYFEDGKMSYDIIYKAGVLNGRYAVYHPNGKLSKEEYYQNGKNVGTYAKYFENGQKETEGVYIDGLAEGKWHYWFDNGQLFSEGNYTKDNKNGNWNWYTVDGKLKNTTDYVNGYINGKYTNYFDNGIKQSEGFERNNIKEGICTIYSFDGKIYSQGNYIAGNKEGKWFFNDSLTGKKESEGVYNKGKFNGKWTFYDSLGNKSSISYYINGFHETKGNISDSIVRLTDLMEYDKALNHIDWLKKVIARDVQIKNFWQATPYYHYGVIYYNQKKYAKSLESYQKYGELTKKYSGDTVNNYAVALNGIAMNHVALNKFNEALEAYEKSLKLQEHVHGRYSVDYTTVLINAYAVYNYMGQPEKREEMLKTELKLREDKFGTNSKETYQLLDAIADIYYYANRLSEAYIYYKKLHDAVEKDKKNQKYYYSNAMRSMAYILDLQGESRKGLNEIMTLLNFSAEIGEGSHTIQFLVDFKSAAVYYSRLGRPDTSKLIYERIGALAEEHGWQNSDVATEAIYGLAILHADIQEYEKAFPLYAKVIKHYENSGKTRTTLFANIMHAYGYALYYSDRSRGDIALKYYKQASDLKKSLLGPADNRSIDALFSLAIMYRNCYKYKESVATLNEAMDDILKATGKDSYNYGYCLYTMGNTESYQSLHKEALASFNEAITYYKKHEAEYVDDYTSILSAISSEYSTLGIDDSSEYYIRQAISIYKKHKGENKIDYLVLNNSLASILLGKSLYIEAEKIYLKNAAQYGAISGKEHLNYVSAIRDAGYFYDFKGDYKKSKIYYTDFKNLSERISGKTSDYTAEAISRLSEVDKKLGNYKEAETNALQACKILKDRYGVNHPNYAAKISKLGDVYFWEKNYIEAERCLAQASNIMGRNFGFESKEYADYQRDLAKVLNKMDKNKEAEQIFINTVANYAKNLGKDSWYYLNALDDLSNFYVSFGQYVEAARIIDEEIAFAKAKGTRIVVGHKLYKKASMLKDWHKYSAADSLANQALDIYENLLERNNISILNTQNLLGLICLDQLRLKEAEEHLRFCVDETKIKNEQNSLSYGIYLNNLSMILMENKQYEKAEKAQKEAVAIFDKTYKKGSLGEISYLDNYAALYQAWGKNDLAETYWLDVNRKLLAYIKNNFYFMSDNEKAQFWQKNSADFENFNTFAITRMKQNPMILGEMYNNQLAIKGILLSASNKIKKRILGSHDSLLINDYHRWIGLKETLAKGYTLSESEQKEQNINVPELEAEANKLEKNMNITAEDVKKESGSVQVSWKDIQKVLGPDEAAIEIIRFRYFDKHRTDSVIFAALILTAETKANPQIVILDRGRDLEKKYLSYYKNTIQLKIDDEESYNNYWGAIEPFVKTKSYIYISPDGVYNSINLNTLRLDNGTYLIDNKNLKIVSNTKDILFIKSKQPIRLSKATATLFGFPKFFVGVNKLKKSTSNERAFSTVDRTGIADLPGTKTEIEKVTTILTNAKWELKNFTDENANEDALKNVQNPRVLHIATHGFFLDEADNHSDNTGLNILRSQQNPLLKSGLLLTGAANFIQDKAAISDENGILTAYEAANLNLENTDLVILSACETGKGEIKNGEGVYGLQRAFQTAGAKAIVMSLWKVNDDATQELMTAFYENWMKGMEKQKAFKAAQMEIKIKFKNPYYWGAFVMVGN